MMTPINRIAIIRRALLPTAFVSCCLLLTVTQLRYYNSNGEFGFSNAGRQQKFAFVFYASNVDYFCHAVVNIVRLSGPLNRNLSAADMVQPEFVVLLEETLEPEKFYQQYPVLTQLKSRIKLLVTRQPNEPDTADALSTYYKHSYLKLEAFKLYDQYSRIIFMDSDGLVLRNLDHLFTMDIRPYQVAAAWSFGNDLVPVEPAWHLTSSFFVADLSPELYAKFQWAMQPENRKQVLELFANTTHAKSVYDMEIFNFVLDQGRDVFLLPTYYAKFDYYFQNTNRTEELAYTFYVHFSSRKPFYHFETRNYATKPELTKGRSEGFRNLFVQFWNETKLYCPYRYSQLFPK